MSGPAGRPAGTVAGTAAGTVAGTVAGTPVGTPSDAAPEPEPDPPPASPSRRLRRPAGRPSWAVVFAALLVAVVCATALAVTLLARPSDAELRNSALEAARIYTTSLTTYDARTLDEDVARVKRVATGEFAEEYDETISGLLDQLQTDQASSAGTVVGVGIERLSRDEATVLVAVNQEITSAGSAPRTEASRLRMALVRRGGNWLVSDVQRL